jgi:hypothetical protein
VVVTSHAALRLGERTPFPLTQLPQILQEASCKGVRLSETTGELRVYLDGQVARHRKGRDSIIYGEYLFVVEGQVLITVFRLAKALQPSVEQIEEVAG